MQNNSSSYMLVLIKSILRLFGLGCGITIAVIFFIPTAFFMFGIYLIDACSNWLDFDSVDSGINRLFKIKAVTKVEETPLPEIKEPLLSADFTKFDKTFDPEQLTWGKFSEIPTAQQLADHMKMWQGLKGKVGFHDNKDNKTFDHQMTLQSKGQTNRNLLNHNTFSPPALSTIDSLSELQNAFHAMPESYQSINRLVVNICGVDIIACFVDPVEGVGYSQHRWIGCASYAVGRIYFLKFPNHNTIMHELIHMYCYLTGQNDRSSFNEHEDMVEFMGCAFFLLREACDSINRYCLDNINILTADADSSSYNVQRTGPSFLRTKQKGSALLANFNAQSMNGLDNVYFPPSEEWTDFDSDLKIKQVFFVDLDSVLSKVWAKQLRDTFGFVQSIHGLRNVMETNGVADRYRFGSDLVNEDDPRYRQRISNSKMLEFTKSNVVMTCWSSDQLSALLDDYCEFRGWTRNQIRIYKSADRLIH